MDVMHEGNRWWGGVGGWEKKNKKVLLKRKQRVHISIMAIAFNNFLIKAGNDNKKNNSR